MLNRKSEPASEKEIGPPKSSAPKSSFAETLRQPALGSTGSLQSTVIWIADAVCKRLQEDGSV